jgi:hypothetical protein
VLVPLDGELLATQPGVQQLREPTPPQGCLSDVVQQPRRQFAQQQNRSECAPFATYPCLRDTVGRSCGKWTWAVQ